MNAECRMHVAGREHNIARFSRSTELSDRDILSYINIESILHTKRHLVHETEHTAHFDRTCYQKKYVTQKRLHTT